MKFEEKRKLMDELLKNKKDYSTLIDFRTFQLSVPKEDRTLSNERFKEKEHYLNLNGKRLRKALGISFEGEVLLCKECGRHFNYISKKFRALNFFKKCKQHTSKGLL